MEYVIILALLIIGLITVVKWIVAHLPFGNKKNKNEKLKDDYESARKTIQYAQQLNTSIEEAKFELSNLKSQIKLEQDSIKNRQTQSVQNPTDYEAYCSKLDTEANRLEKQIATLQKQIDRNKEKIRSIKYASEIYDDLTYRTSQIDFSRFDSDELHGVSQNDLMCMQIKELRTLFKKNQKEIDELVVAYQGRYTTKTNATLYKLLVLALEAEMKNVYHDLRFGKLETTIETVRRLTSKYYTIATEGNQTVAPTLQKFIARLEYHYIEAVKIEYEFYVKQERAREEQRALREQMRQEAEERKMLEQQKKQIEAEESKYQKEISRIEEMLRAANEQEMAALREQLAKVQSQLSSVSEKKDEIIRLQNGKAGTIYVISNIGSFGENVFKIGMTRRLEPMDRVRELGDASVPFPFDVHCFIFSEDAVSLETAMHHELNSRRVNKVNLRKEFFNISIDEIQNLVERIDPSAAFNRTAAAEQYRQSLNIQELPDNIDELTQAEFDE